MKSCGSANPVKIDKPLLINHRLGKITLHDAATSRMTNRFHLTENAYLVVETRTYGSAWSPCPQGLPEPVHSIVRDFLISRNNYGYYFLYDDQIETLVQRHKG